MRGNDLNLNQLYITDVDGTRRIDAANLPLRVGTGSDCGLRLPGPGGAPVVMLDLLDGAPFVQPVGRDTPVELNGETLSASTRLRDGDELQFFGSRILVSLNDDRLDLDVRLEDSAYVTKPPELDEAAGAGEDESIAPTAFKRAADTRAVVVEQHRSPLKAILGAGLVLLLAASYLLFSSKSIQFEVRPDQPDELEIAGGWFRLPLGDRVLMRKGDYVVTVRKAGYYEVSQNFEVDDAPSKTITVDLRRLPGELTVLTDPPVEAVVAVDDGLVGKAPYGPVELQPGPHSISVQAERYLPFSDVVDIAGLGAHEELHVQLVPRWSNVEVVSEPAGATIFAGNDEIGVTPATVELLEGTHQISVVRDGFNAWDGTVEAEANVDQSLPLIRLEPANAKLLVNSIPRGANVTVDGRYRGQSPITLSLSPGVDYRIGLSKAGYGATSRQVRLQAAASDSISVDLSARTGTVTVNVQPADANVYVDGRAQGPGAATLRLSSAPHRIEVRKTGYETWSRTVTPRPGYPQTVTANLRSLEAIARSKIATRAETAQGSPLRRVEPGTFVMGSSRAEPGRRANEVLVPVEITRPFFIGVHEVTNKEFAEFREGHDSGADIHPSMSGGDNPVANVSWADAAEYCNWLSAREGLEPAYEQKFGEWVVVRPLTNGYRLPTEAEWAWAIRYQGTPSAQRFPWGKDMPPKKNSGNYADKAAESLVPSIIPRYDDGYASTSPVGKFAANALGIHDGSGNVAEWVNDFYSVPTPGTTSAVKDPLGPGNGKTHVIRGSSWRHAGEMELRPAFRDHSPTPRSDVGFRVARFVE
jgi:formylglycine-generating enzyme required for sulfatase activity